MTKRTKTIFIVTWIMGFIIGDFIIYVRLLDWKLCLVFMIYYLAISILALIIKWFWKILGNDL
jgi:hypothetical protein